MRHIGERVREARKEANMTQELLARRAGLSLNMLSRLELGKIQDPHISSLRQIAHAVGVPVEVLVSEGETAEMVGAGKAEAPRSGQQRRATGEPADVPDTLEALLERCGARTRHLADSELLMDALRTADVDETARIAKEVADEITAITPALRDFRHNPRASRLVGQAWRLHWIAKLSLAAARGATLTPVLVEADERIRDAEAALAGVA